MSKLHPTFERAPLEQQWRGGSLRALFETLEQEARATPRRWYYRVMFSGACVGMRLMDDKIEMKLVRQEAPKTEAGPEKFRFEVDTFRRGMAIQHYRVEEHPEDPRVGIGALLFEPTVRSGHKVWCIGCNQVLVERNDCFPLSGQQCTACAFRSGREYAAEVAARYSNSARK